MEGKEVIAMFPDYDSDCWGKKRGFVARLVPTWGGGSPPAPMGHSGSMKLRWGVLHSQSGEGLAMDQLPLVKRSLTAGSTAGVNQSVAPAGSHGRFLEKSRSLFLRHLEKRRDFLR